MHRIECPIRPPLENERHFTQALVKLQLLNHGGGLGRAFPFFLIFFVRSKKPTR